MSWLLVTSGYDPGPPIDDIAEARQVLGEAVAESLAACRRKFGQATKVRLCEDSYSILIGDRHSVSRWATHTLVKL